MANFLRFGEIEREVTAEDPETTATPVGGSNGCPEDDHDSIYKEEAGGSKADIAGTPLRSKRDRRRFTTSAYLFVLRHCSEAH